MLRNDILVPFAFLCTFGEFRDVFLTLAVGKGECNVVAVEVSSIKVVINSHKCEVVVDGNCTAEVVGFRVHGCTRIVGRIFWKIAVGDAQICELGLLIGTQFLFSPQVESVFLAFGYGQLECEASDGS